MAFAPAANSGNSAQAEMVDSMTRSFEFPATVCRFCALPVEKSSITTTAFPSANSRSTRCEPMKPAPPVTKVNEDGGWMVEDGIESDWRGLEVKNQPHFAFRQKSSARSMVLFIIPPRACQAMSRLGSVLIWSRGTERGSATRSGFAIGERKDGPMAF